MSDDATAKTDAAGRSDDEAVDRNQLMRCFQRLCRQLDTHVSDAEIRAAAPAEEGAPDLRSLLRAAERLGFAVRLERPSRRALEQTPTPFMVVGAREGEAWLARGRAGRHLVMVDPTKEHAVAHTPESVARMAQQIVQLSAPEEQEEAPPCLWRDAIWRRLKPVMWQLLLASVVLNLLALAMPLFLMTVYNKVIDHAALRTLDVLAVGMVTLLAFEWLLRAIRGYLAGHTGARLDAAIGSEVVHHLFHLPYRVIEAMPTGHVLERLRQLDTVRQFFTGQVPLLLVDLAFVFVFVAGLFVIAPPLAWLVVAAVPAFVVLSLVAHRRQRALVAAGFHASAAKSAALSEAFGQSLTVKALGLEPELERRFEGRLAEAAWTGFKASHLHSMISAAGQGMQALVALALVYFGARLVVAGELSVGALIASTLLAARVLGPLRQAVGAWHQVQGVRTALERLDELLAKPAMRLVGQTTGRLQLRGRVRFEDVTFRYGDAERAALSGVSLELEPGRVTAVVGPPGSGKSTLARLLIGLDEPEEGRVLLDDIDLRHVSPVLLRQHIGVVPQEVELFSGTIADNIAIGAADPSAERVVAAAKFAGVHDAVQRLPRGYDTPLGERGLGLSAGQRQLIAVARALMRNPRILVLDEATSALDAGSEEYLLGNLKRAARGRTLLVITHRLSALSIADRVAYMVDGQIERVGPAVEVAAYARGRQAGSGPMRGRGPTLATIEGART